MSQHACVRVWEWERRGTGIKTVSIWQKDASKALWDTLGIKPHFHRSPQKGVHSSFIKKENNNTQPPFLFLSSPLPLSLALFPSALARPDRPKGLSWPHLIQIYPHIPCGFPVTSYLPSQPTRPILSTNIPGKPGLIDVFHDVSTFTFKHIQVSLVFQHWVECNHI